MFKHSASQHSTFPLSLTSFSGYDFRSGADFAWRLFQVQRGGYRGQYQREICKQSTLLQLPQTACSLIFWLGTFLSFFQRSYKKSVCAFVSMTCSSHQMAWSGTVLVWSTLTVRPNGKMHHDACKSRFRWLWWPVKFRMIVFRPFKGEILLGKITSGTENGIKSKSFRDRVICLEWILTVS